MALATDLGAIAELASRADSLESYERALLALLARRVGFDVALCARAEGLGPHAPGLEACVRREAEPLWTRFQGELAPVADRARIQGGVAVDVEVLGTGALEPLSYYQRVMRPHGGRATAMLYLEQRGQIVGAYALGRTGGGFRRRELGYLRAIARTLTVCHVGMVASEGLHKSPLAKLTCREREVVSYLPLGYTNAQIALALGTAARTVRNQLSSAYEKLGVASRAEAVARWSEAPTARPRPTRRPT